MRNKTNAHAHELSRAYKNPNKTHFMLQTESRAYNNNNNDKKKFTMRIRQNPNSNYFNSMFAHYVVLSMLPLLYASSCLTKSEQSRHARRRACSHTCECFEVVFCSLHIVIYFSDDHTRDRAKYTILYINCLGSFHAHTTYTMKWFT